MGWSRTSSACVEIRNLLLVKCNQALSNCTKKSSLFCFCRFLCLLDLSICFCLNRARPWLELSIKFNWYSLRFFQRALVRFNHLWIHVIFKYFFFFFFEYLCLKYLSKQGAELCASEVACFVAPEEVAYSFSNFL